MNFIDFESARAKETIREELRVAREEALKQAQRKAEKRNERSIAKKLRGEQNWMLPSIEKKLLPKKVKKSKTKHSKKSKKDKKRKSKNSKGKYSSDSEEEILTKKSNNKDHNSSEDSCSDSATSSNSDSDQEEDEWIEKEKNTETQTSANKVPTVRDDWMTNTSQLFLPTYSKPKDLNIDKEKASIESYDPKKNIRELNPYWKDGGDGLPIFKKPRDDDRSSSRNSYHNHTQKYSTGNWRKNPPLPSKSDDKKDHHHYPRKEETITRSQESNRNYDRNEDSCTKSSNYNYNRTANRESSNTGRRTNDNERESTGTRRRTDDNERESTSTSTRRRTDDNEKESTSTGRRTDDNESENQKESSTKNKDASSASKKKSENFMTDEQMNELGAKVIKAEIMGNDDLAKTLKEKLENARMIRNQIKEDNKQAFIEKAAEINDDKKPSQTSLKKQQEEHILLTRTDSNTGASRPLTKHKKPIDPWGGRNCKSNKNVETHLMGERVRYFADDDRYDIKQMFEREKYSNGADADEQFVNIAGKHKNPKDDLEDIFEDKVRKNISEANLAKKEEQKAINEHENLTKILDNCDKCLESKQMNKQLMVSMGTTVYLSLPWHEGLQIGHCLIIPIQHHSCSTQLDENTWSEITDYRKALTRMFTARKQDVIFFETARYLHRRSHMVIHCIASSKFEMAPFYFKKAIQESETEWCTNKQLITLKDKDLRRVIPKGLPYFWVNFGMDMGFAHVIEDQERFPSNFAQEIIGGLLNLEPKLWRRPRKEFNSILKTKQFADWFKSYDFTN